MKNLNSRFGRLFVGATCAVALLLLAVFTVRGATPESPLSNQINAVNQRLRGALQRCDVQALADGYTPDARMMGPGQVITGREAIEKHMASACKVVKDFHIEDQEYVGDSDSAVETGVITFFAPDKTVVAKQRYMTLWKEGSGGWQIYRTISVPYAVGELEPPAAENLFNVKKTEASYAIVLPMKGSYSQHEQALARIRDYLGKSGIPISGPPFGRYMNSPLSVPEGELKWEVGYIVPSGSRATAPFEAREFPSATVVSALISGPYDATRPWIQLGEWTLQHGYVPAGPPTEVWLEGPKTEMLLPVSQ